MLIFFNLNGLSYLSIGSKESKSETPSSSYFKIPFSEAIYSKAY